MKDKELKEMKYIDEESYQQIKKSMCKDSDYFTKEEIEKNWRNFSVMYMR